MLISELLLAHQSIHNDSEHEQRSKTNARDANGSEQIDDPNDFEQLLEVGEDTHDDDRKREYDECALHHEVDDWWNRERGFFLLFEEHCRADLVDFFDLLFE